MLSLAKSTMYVLYLSQNSQL